MINYSLWSYFLKPRINAQHDSWVHSLLVFVAWSYVDSIRPDEYLTGVTWRALDSLGQQYVSQKA
jgi:hypothetical protein